MKKKIIAMLLAAITVLGVMSTVSFAETGESGIYSEFENKQIDYNTYTDEFGMTVDITSYADSSVTSNNSLIVYVINHMGVYPGQESDETIIASYLGEGYVVTVLDYNNHPLAVSPYIESSVQQIRYDIINNKKYTGTGEDKRTVDPNKSYVLPAGYRLARDVVYFQMASSDPDTRGSASDAALNEIVRIWNTQSNSLEKLYEAGYTDMVTKTDAGKYVMNDAYKAKSWQDIIMKDGSKMTSEDTQLKMDIVYPSEPIMETPVAVLAASGTPRAGNATKLTRQHSVGFLFRGYTTACYDHEFMPFMTVEVGGWDSSEPQYTTQTYDAVKTHTAAIRCIKFWSQEYGYSNSKIGVYGHSKSSYVSLLTSSASENLLESNNDGEKNYGEQPFLYYDEEKNNPINADITCAYHSMGNGSSRSRYIVNSQSVPTMIACGQMDTGNGCSYWEAEKNAYRLSNSTYIAMDMKDIGHDFPNGVDPVYNYDRYLAFCKFFDYYLKDTNPEILYTSLVDGKIKGIKTTKYEWGKESQYDTAKQWKEVAGDKIFVQFSAPVTEWSFLEAVSLKDSKGNAVEGYWYAEGNGNKWIFKGETSSSETYTLTIADNTVKDKYGRVVENGYNTEGDTDLLPITENVDIKPLGRAGFVNGTFTADHAASGLALKLDCEGYVGFNITTAKTVEFSVTVDGETTKNVVVAAGTSNLKVAENLQKGIHTVEIVNETGLINGSSVEFNSISLNGSVVDAPENSKYLIEFIGDSITAGYGLSESEEGNHHDATLSYAYLTADALGVDYSILAKTGMGIVCGWPEGNFPINTFENVYPYANVNIDKTEFKPARTPDIVVINLNTNDNNRWETENCNEEKYNEKFKGMITKITEQYGKDIPMLFVFGCMANDEKTKATDQSQNLVETVYTAENGYNIKVATLSASKDGKDNHPTAEGAKTQAEELVSFIKANYDEFKDTQ